MSLKKKNSIAGTTISLYAGAGGMDIGFHQAGFDPIWSNDIDPYAVSTYSKIFKKHTITVGDIMKQVLPKKGAADIVIGGPPCQGFSIAGKMDPNDPRSKHVKVFMEIVRRVQPKAFVMENVSALANNQRWASIRNELIKTANKLGYQTEIHVLNSADFGVPQARERMFMIGIQGGGKVNIKKEKKEAEHMTVKQALEQLPSWGYKGNDGKCTAIITPAKTPILRKSPFAGMLFNGQGRPINLDKPALTLPASMGGNRTPIIDQEELEHGKESWIIEYHKYLTNGGKPLKKVPERLRRLTVQEAQLLQTFPKGMEFEGSLSIKFRQIGNAVPPMLAYHVAKALRDAIF